MKRYRVGESPSGTCESGGGTPASGSNGFTLLELLVTIAIASILAAIAAPSFRVTIEATRRTSAVSSIADAIATARVEAVTRGVPVTLCATSEPDAADPGCSGANTWERGIVVRDAAGAIQVWGALPAGLTLRSSGFGAVTAGRVAYAIDGTLASARSGSFTLCDGTGVGNALGFVVSVSGLARVALDSDDDGTVEDHAAAEVVCL